LKRALNQKRLIIAQRKRKVILHNDTQSLVAKVVKNTLIDTSIENLVTAYSPDLPDYRLF